MFRYEAGRKKHDIPLRVSGCAIFNKSGAFSLHLLSSDAANLYQQSQQSTIQ